ncbi:hypothetical protein DCS_06724 [Drechmeria coniospora]|uniref:Uncharacterized protein n=1 Tax=Drechmeria coniospora TaxID=98403 RepID=A0A151GCI9_DRECN|nr:hypothetical protein DCS_06724 [Drechmeria coniospora]KYK54764.1 hypothetical protein DCS_06724 [Drechmeria coniospora]
MVRGQDFTPKAPSPLRSDRWQSFSAGNKQHPDEPAPGFDETHEQTYSYLRERKLAFAADDRIPVKMPHRPETPQLPDPPAPAPAGPDLGGETADFKH